MWRKRFKKKSTGRRTKILLLTALLLLVVVSLFILSKSSLFAIKKIDVSTKNVACADENQLRNSALVLGQSFFLTNFKNLEKNIKAKFICIKDINFAFTFPDRIKIQAIGRQPVAFLASLRIPEATTSALLENIATPSAEQSQEAFLMDGEGIVFSKDIGGLDIPKIYLYNADLNLGKKVTDIKNVLKILDTVKIFRLDTKTSIIWNNYLMIFSYPKLIFQLDDKVDTQLASLQLILDKAKIDLKELAFIDLRFDKPIVKFAPTK